MTYSNQSRIPDVAREIIDLWWSNAERDLRFGHLNHVLPAVGASCAPELWPELLDRSRSEDEESRRLAAEVLGWLGGAAAPPEVLGRLTDLLGNENLSVGWIAAEALARIIHKPSDFSCRTRFLKQKSGLPTLLLGFEPSLELDLTIVDRKGPFFDTPLRRWGPSTWPIYTGGARPQPLAEASALRRC
jgi:hypothetical protein